MSDSTTSRSQFAAFWLYSRKDTWRETTHASWDSSVAEFASVLANIDPSLTVRGVYSLMGFDARADLMIWVHGPQLAPLTSLAAKIDQTTIGRSLNMVESYFGMVGLNMYDPTHGPAFMKGEHARTFLSVYPFIKSHDWYQIGFEERRRLMMEHGQLGREFPQVVTNTLDSCGVQDQEFTIALEGDEIKDIIEMAKKLRTAEVRPYTTVDTPIYLGELMDPAAALETIKG